MSSSTENKNLTYKEIVQKQREVLGTRRGLITFLFGGYEIPFKNGTSVRTFTRRGAEKVTKKYSETQITSRPGVILRRKLR